MNEPYTWGHRTIACKGLPAEVYLTVDDMHGSPLDEQDYHGVTETLNWNPENAEDFEYREDYYEFDIETAARFRMMRPLHKDRGSYLMYDMMYSVRRFVTVDGCTPEDARIRAEADYEYLRDWYNNQWYWCAMHVQVQGHEVASLWGLESTIEDVGNEAWFDEVMQDLAHESAQSEPDGFCVDEEVAHDV